MPIFPPSLGVRVHPGEQFSPGSTHAQRAVEQPQITGAAGDQKDPVPPSLPFLCLVHSLLVLSDNLVKEEIKKLKTF